MALSRELPLSFREALRVSAEILSTSRELLERGGISSEAEQILAAALRRTGAAPRTLSRTELFARLDDRLPAPAGEQVLLMSHARAIGRPLQHLTGVQAFLDHEYRVGPDVLVPRPETEVLVSEAIARLRPRGAAFGLEIGLGSGIISIELLAAFPGLRMLASELTDAAAARARENAERILDQGAAGAGRLRIVMAGASEALEPLERELGDARADFLISNPPYVARGDEVDREVLAHEPLTALYPAGEDPLLFYREIAGRGRGLLKDGALVLVEVPHERAARIRAMFEREGWRATLIRDLTGRERVLVAE